MVSGWWSVVGHWWTMDLGRCDCWSLVGVVFGRWSVSGGLWVVVRPFWIMDLGRCGCWSLVIDR